MVPDVSLSEEDLASGADALSSLSCTLVGPGLKADHGLAGSQLFLREVTFAFLRRLGAQVGSLPFRMLVRLRGERGNAN